MAKKKVFLVGLELPEVEGIETIPIDGDQSLLDADIVLFRPSLKSLGATEHYAGEPLFGQSTSARVRALVQHWPRQLQTAAHLGKSIVILLPGRESYFYYTGNQEFSGTGRSRRATQIVNPCSNFDLLPLKIPSFVDGRGREMKLASGGELLAAYWREHEDLLEYNGFFAPNGLTPLAFTKAGDRVVAGLTAPPERYLILPDIFLEHDDFNEEGDDGRAKWTQEAIEFTYRFRDIFIEIDDRLGGKGDETPEPDWAKATAYRLAAEASLERELEQLTEQIDCIERQRAEKRLELQKIGALRVLLFGKGKQLEAAVRDALVLLGFETQKFNKDGSEFDALFTSSDGRFLGEVEGKDAKPINVDKFSQLLRNVGEDLRREDVSLPAKGVLFGNAHRQVPVASRDEFFTEKDLAAAKANQVALIRTPDLFEVARYLAASSDASFAALCRKAISDGAGVIVKFPVTPVAEETAVEVAGPSPEANSSS